MAHNDSINFLRWKLENGITDDDIVAYWFRTGAQGPQGFQGILGPQGGTSGLMGPQGSTGANFLFFYGSFASGPSGSGTSVIPTGSMWYHSVTGVEYTYVFDGTSYVWATPAGLMGAQGPQGLTGVIGSTGIGGSTGPQGLQGPQGSLPSSPSYIEVAISSAQILDMSATEIILLPTLASNQYYLFNLVLEYTAGATAYSHTDPWGIYGDACEYIEFSNNFTLGLDNRVFRVSSENEKFPANSYGEAPGSAVKMYTNGGPAPTLGTGTILAKIWYEIKTFGTEL